MRLLRCCSVVVDVGIVVVEYCCEDALTCHVRCVGVGGVFEGCKELCWIIMCKQESSNVVAVVYLL